MPLGTLLGGWVIERVGDAAPVFAGIGVLEVVIPLCFAFTALGHAERYLPNQRDGDRRNPGASRRGALIPRSAVGPGYAARPVCRGRAPQSAAARSYSCATGARSSCPG